MSHIKLSIIIPHYNSVDLLEKLLLSIPKERELEILLIDDNSTEKADKLQKLVQNRTDQIRFFQNEPGKNSAGCCRNIGLKHAQGEWLLFADADDYFEENFYETIEPYFNQKYDIVYFAPVSRNVTDGSLSNRHISLENLVCDYINEPDKKHETLLRYEFVGPCSKLIRGDLVRQGGICFDEVRVANDVMFSMKCAVSAGNIAASRNVIYCITKGETTLTTSIKREDVRTRLKVAVRRYKYLKSQVDRESWKILDLRIDRYERFFKKYKMGRADRIWAWCYMLGNGVRPCISRQTNVRSLFSKLIGKISIDR